MLSVQCSFHCRNTKAFCPVKSCSADWSRSLICWRILISNSLELLTRYVLDVTWQCFKLPPFYPPTPPLPTPLPVSQLYSSFTGRSQRRRRRLSVSRCWFWSLSRHCLLSAWCPTCYSPASVSPSPSGRHSPSLSATCFHQQEPKAII